MVVTPTRASSTRWIIPATVCLKSSIHDFTMITGDRGIRYLSNGGRVIVVGVGSRLRCHGSGG